jgi:hypothetical protein
MAMPPTQSTGAWLSPTDAAKLLGFTKSYVGKLGQKKKVRVKKGANGRQLYNKSDVVKLAKANTKKAKPKKKAKAKPSKPTEWLGIADAKEVAGLTASGVQYAARKGHIRRKKTAKAILYAAEDCASYRPRANANGHSKPNSEVKPEPTTTSARMSPKQAQTAVQKARWVFEGLDMGAIVSDGEALGLLRNIFYEGTD